MYAPTWEGYRDAWDLLEQPTSQCAVRLPQAWRTWVDDPRVGLPPGHPWGDALPDWQAGRQWKARSSPTQYETRTVAYAQELGYDVHPIEAYLRHETGAYLDP